MSYDISLVKMILGNKNCMIQRTICYGKSRGWCRRVEKLGNEAEVAHITLDKPKRTNAARVSIWWAWFKGAC